MASGGLLSPVAGMGVGADTSPPQPSGGTPACGARLRLQNTPELELGKQSQAAQGRFYAFTSEIAIVGEDSLRLWNHKFFKVSGLHF